MRKARFDGGCHHLIGSHFNRVAAATIRRRAGREGTKRTKGTKRTAAKWSFKKYKTGLTCFIFFEVASQSAAARAGEKPFPRRAEIWYTCGRWRNAEMAQGLLKPKSGKARAAAEARAGAEGHRVDDQTDGVKMRKKLGCALAAAASRPLRSAKRRKCHVPSRAPRRRRSGRRF